ncbi:MAG TPA: hypothetical protein VGS22_09800 [Thermoanaerobaculia bacterium]|jgi:hypothetical protein|nr:hypothetical protein [Thermoanaerobaculia bacterium]
MFKKVTILAAALSLAAVSLPSFAAANATGATRVATSHTATTTTTTTTTKPGKAIGEISALDATGSSLVVKTKSKTDTFAVPATAKITSHGKAITLHDLKVGEKVEVTYSAQGSTMTASAVTLLGHA